MASDGKVVDDSAAVWCEGKGRSRFSREQCMTTIAPLNLKRERLREILAEHAPLRIEDLA